MLKKNSDLVKMKAIKIILTGISSEISLNVDSSPSDISNMQYSPITLIEVEISFSRYKAVLRFKNAHCHPL